MECRITIREGTGYLSGLPPEANEALIDATSFRPDGYQYTVAFKKKRTDGRVKLYKHSRFPAGLLSRVLEVLRAQGVAYDVEYERSEQVKPDLPPLRLVGVQSRPYQDDAVEAAILHPRGVIRAPTGSGKTAIGCRVIVARGKWALVVVPTIDLLYQFKGFLEEHLQEAGVAVTRRADGAAEFRVPTGRVRIGQLGDGVVDPQPITVATVRTAANALGVAYAKYEYGEYDDSDDTEVDPRALREWVERIGTLVVDEAHILGAQTVYDIATKVPAPNKYGFSASPWRDDGADLMIEAATGPQIYHIPTEVLVRDGYLVPPIIQTIDTKGWWEPAAWGETCTRCGAQRPRGQRGTKAQKCSQCGGQRWRSEYQDAYNHEIVENAIRNWRIAELVQTWPAPRLVLVKLVKHGKLFEPLLPEAVFLSGTNRGRDRIDVYDDVRSGKLETLICTSIADMGLDLPALRTLVLAGGGKSSTRHLQRIGRVARPHPGKDHALVVDFDDSHVHSWFKRHAAARRKIEAAEWGQAALWI